MPVGVPRAETPASRGPYGPFDPPIWVERPVRATRKASHNDPEKVVIQMAGVTSTARLPVRPVKSAPTVDVIGGSAQNRGPSRAEAALVWTFGILDMLLDVAADSAVLARRRLRLLRRLTRSEAR